ncbi:MAG: hypothetical protein AAFW73_22310 [Bacteroidota bacterium]
MPCRRFLCLTCLLFLTSLPLSAQDAYVHAAGLRAGPITGLSYKRFVTFAGTVEGILGYNFNNGRTFSLTGLYQQHFFISYDLNAFAGGGMSFGARSDDFRWIAEVVAGLEYSFPRFPLQLSLDYKPAYRILGNELIFDEFGITIRYIIQR